MQESVYQNEDARQVEFRQFVASHVEPSARYWDRDEQIPASAIRLLAQAGYLGITLPVKYGGKGWDIAAFGFLCEALGRGMAAFADLVTVQAMVSMTLLKWGSNAQKEQWLPPLATGELIGAFALTEPTGGSDLQSLRTEFRPSKTPGSYLLTGEKTWISFGTTAGVFLVFGQCNQQPMACLVPRGAPGLEMTEIKSMMGFRAAGLAQVRFRDVEVPPANLVGKPGVALAYIAPVGLHYGRISTACSALGLLRGCFEASITHASNRVIGKEKLGNVGMIRSMLARMGTDLRAGQLLCHEACLAADRHLPEAFVAALAAKYFTSKAAARAAADAVQIHGAAGCHEDAAVARYYRDAKIMEIIEGTSQVHEDLLGKSFLEGASHLRCATNGLANGR